MASPNHIDQLDLQGFTSWLERQDLDDVSVDLLKPTNKWEVIRYRTRQIGDGNRAGKNGTHIIYCKASGQLTFCGWSGKHYRDFERGRVLGEPVPKGQKSTGNTRAMGSRQKWRKVSTLLERDGDSCCFCHDPLGTDITIEHLLPRSKGGTNVLANLALAHEKCNKEAADLPIVEKLKLMRR